jgi:hypothetical protein
VLRGLALLAIAAHLAFALPGALSRTGTTLWTAAVRAGQDRGAVRQELRGAAYSAEIARLCRLLPSDTAYALVAAGRESAGGANWVRYDLAPRRAVYLGNLRNLPGPARTARRLPPDLPWVVIAGDPGVPPRVFGREDFLRVLRELRRAGG